MSAAMSVCRARALWRLLPLLLASMAAVSAGPLEDVVAEREAKLESALERLREARSAIEAERVPLARKLNRLEAEAEKRDDELAEARRFRDNREVRLETLRERVTARRKEIDYISRTLLPGFVADYDANLHPPERSVAGEAVREYNLFLEKPDAAGEAKLSRGLDLIGGALGRIEARLGGTRTEGRALTADGTVRKGRFVQVGPLAYFAPEDGTAAGMAMGTEGHLPDVASVPDDAARAVAAVAASGEGELPVDPTLGEAVAVDRATDSIRGHLEKGGIWVYPILAFAVVATLVAVVKTVQVFGVRHPKPMVVHTIVKHLRAGETEAAREVARRQPEPSRTMLTAAVEHAGESTEMVEEVMYECMLTTQPRLERFLNVIAVTAAAAPLLGLLGTVTGIIKTFRLMTVFGAGDPKPLISGISEALITTELGLILAIPALILHAMLARKVAGTMARMEKTAVALVNGLSRKQTEAGGASA